MRTIRAMCSVHTLHTIRVTVMTPLPANADTVVTAASPVLTVRSGQIQVFGQLVFVANIPSFLVCVSGRDFSVCSGYFTLILIMTYHDGVIKVYDGSVSQRCVAPRRNRTSVDLFVTSTILNCPAQRAWIGRRYSSITYNSCAPL